MRHPNGTPFRNNQDTGTRTAPPLHPAFWQQITMCLEANQDIAAVATWQGFAKAIAAHGGSIRNQSTVATMSMLEHAAIMIIRLRSLAAKGKEEDSAAKVFEAWLDEIRIETNRLAATDPGTPLDEEAVGPIMDDEGDEEDEE